MDRTADLDSSLSFVIRRIEEQATRSGEPLSEEQRMLLNYLPTSSSGGGSPEDIPVPRNFDYERLCALGKTAYLSDRQANPASLDWEFAFAVFALNRHPMWGILKLAGLKQRRPLWDQLLLIIAALVFIVATMLVMLLAGKQAWPLFKRVVIVLGYAAIFLLAYFASRRTEERQFEKDIEKCRSACRFVGKVTN
jgi:hypothetical protein